MKVDLTFLFHQSKTTFSNHFILININKKMKHLLILLGCMLFTVIVFAQPANDECTAPIVLPDISTEFCASYTNMGATTSIVSTNPSNQVPSCWTGTDRDVWFLFQAKPGLEDITITITPNGTIPIFQPQIAIYRGFCVTDNLFPRDCAAANSGANNVTIDALGLTTNSFYFIRVSDYATSNAGGDFELCIKPYVPFINMMDGSSTACNGTLLDSGGLDNDYSSDENFIYTVTPSESPECITIHIDSFNLEFQWDRLNIYDGNDIASLRLVSLTGIGKNMEFQASSGSVTFEFISDAGVEETGFGLTWSCNSTPCTYDQPISINSNVNQQDLIDQFATPQVVIENITLNCPGGAFGTFESTDLSNLGIEKGVILSTGLASNAKGPNMDMGADDDTQFGAPGDPQLDALDGAGEQLTEDACILEFDVFVATDELSFDYVFASEEYPEFAPPINSFNDVFAFFISGPGFSEPTNIAVLPVSGNPSTSINTVNPITNNEFYIDNNGGLSIEYDAFTTVLEARADVIPCNYYHLKLAIADRNDDQYDSGVFISDLRAGTPSFIANFEAFDEENILVEDCGTQDTLEIRISRPSAERDVFQIEYGALPAENGSDISMIPDSIVFEVGEQSVFIPIQAINDNLEEGDEGFYLKITSEAGCGVVVLDSIFITVKDELQVKTGQSEFYACEGSPVPLSATGATDFIWSPSTSLDNATSPNPIATPTSDQQYTVTGTLGNCTDQATTMVRFINPEFRIDPINDINYCVLDQTENISLSAINNTNNQGITWTTNKGEFISNNNTISVLPNISTTYIAHLNVAGCPQSDTIQIIVDALPDLTITANAPTSGIIGTEVVEICQSELIYLTSPAFAGYPNITHEWTKNGQSFTPPKRDLNIIDQPTETTTVYTRTSTNGVCTQVDEITVIIKHDGLTFNPSNPTICIGEEIELSVVGADDFTWADQSSLSDLNIFNPNANPTETTTYPVTGTIGDCELIGEVTVNVLDIEFDISINPTAATINAGESVDLEVLANFITGGENINYAWTPQEGLSNPNSNILMAMPLTTTTYTVTATTESGCIQTASIDIEVLPPPDVEMPTVFSPNNDDVNDTFGPVYYPPLVIERFQVFDRWGELVFDNKNERWDGTLNDKPLPPDVYIYLVKVNYPDGTSKQIKGDITLVR